MKKENDEITDLFRSRLRNAEMTVRDGFWEELNSEMMVRSHHRKVVFFRVAAAASVLLVLAASSAAFWFFSPKAEIEEAYSSGGCQRKYNTSGWRRGETGFYPYALRTGSG